MKSQTSNRVAFWFCLLATALPAAAQIQIADTPEIARLSNGTMGITAARTEGRSEGFALTDQTSGKQLARIALAQAPLTARCEVRSDALGASLSFTNFRGGPDASSAPLGEGALITVSLSSADPFPTVRLVLPMAERARTVLLCDIEKADVFYRGGLQTPLANLDSFPLASAEVGGEQEGGWLPGVELSEFPIPALGLWSPARKTFVAYCFRRGNDGLRSGRKLMTACRSASDGTSHPSFGLTAPASGTNCQFALIHTTDLPQTGTPNAFVLRGTWLATPACLPPTPETCDVGWMPKRDDVPPSPSPALALLRAPSRSSFNPESLLFEDDAVLPVTTTHQAIRKTFVSGDPDRVKRLLEDWKRLKRMAIRTRSNRTRCISWRYPLAGDYTRPLGGKAAASTTAPVTWQVGSYALALYAATGDKDFLAYIDGVLNWTRTCVSTRTGNPHTPWATSAAAANAGSQFLLEFYHQFRGTRKRNKKAQEALELGTTLIYRHLAIYVDDPNPEDAFDPTFLIQGDNRHGSFGRVAWGETSHLLRAMAMYHVETGDPTLGRLLRGALQRWHVGYSQSGTHTIEELDLTAAGERHARRGRIPHSSRLAEHLQPVGASELRILCGEAAAMAFSQGAHLGVADYTFRSSDSFGFRLTGQAAPNTTITVTRPFGGLRNLELRVNGVSRLPLTISPDDTNVTIDALAAGDTVTLGKRLDLRPTSERDVPVTLDRPFANGFEFVLLSGGTSLDVSWQNGLSWAGLSPGQHTTVHRIPFALLPGPVSAVDLAQRPRTFRMPSLPRSVFLFVERTPAPLAATVSYADGTKREVHLDASLPALKSSPLRSWKIDMYPIASPHPAPRITAIELKGKALLFSATSHPSTDRAAKLLGRIRARNKRPEREARTTPKLTALVRTLRAEVRNATRGKALRIAFIPPLADHAETLRLACALLGTSPAILTPQEAADPAQLNPDQYAVVVHAGPETFLHTVHKPGDAVNTLKGYIQAGGCLVSAAWGWPFFYALEAKGQTLTRIKGLPNAQTCAELKIGINSARCPAPRELPHFELVPGQPVLRHLSSPMPFSRAVGGGYRLATPAGLPEGDIFTPALILRDASGRDHGAVVADIQHRCTEYRNGRVVFLWANILRMDEGLPIALEVMSHAIRTAIIPDRPVSAPAIAVLPRDVAEHAQAIEKACVQTGLPKRVLTPAEFADPAIFNPANFPIAIHAVDGEYFIDAIGTRTGLWRNYVDYVRGGGFLVACGTMWQFYYHSRLGKDGEWRQKPDPVRPIENELRLAIGSSRFQDNRPKYLHCLPGQDVITFPGPMDVNHLSWGEYRGVDVDPILGPTIVPLAELRDAQGNSFGRYAAALIRYKRHELRSVELVWLWGNLLETPDGQPLLIQALQYAAKRQKAMFPGTPQPQQ
ncbi:MAG: hypothetical protein HN742_33555 [Lentisphaerae bacterium]|nr:hypothetical protein [Lentisphaerota bacterium]MBT5611272.1 hypothetical protein [Lentisphaerota bacterium]MBT7058411.1 hypothetical protein [Lentisphaerota bacterium]MBT7846846.1 hypothetical protein [Lentisphaerota bacterium]